MNKKSNTCLICSSASNKIISNEVREGSQNVLRCDDCNFIFLQDYEALDYTQNYGSYTASNDWSEKEKVIKRSESLLSFNNEVADLIRDKRNGNILEIGAGNGASLYGLNKLYSISGIDCIEPNENDKRFLEQEFGSKVYSNFSDLEKKYDVIFGHHVFEHFIDPIAVMQEIENISSKDCKLYFSLPNFNDFYEHTLNSEEKEKYLKFNFHLAHPYYYTIESFSNLIEKLGIWEISHISTVQDYSILNYFNWYINGVKSKDIESGTKVNKNIEQLNNAFIEIIEKMHKGNNISVVLEKRS
tara:strand:+ start:293 stop:1192 length:900 start_codon:yes stop_codon:yes gene_type:complete